MSLLLPRFTEAEMELAHERWGANCGPTAAAAILGLTLDEVRPLFEAAGFAERGYTNPTMMLDVLRAHGCRWEQRTGTRLPADPWPIWGLARIQWEGPWMAPSVPKAASYRHTHWVGAARRAVDPAMTADVGIYDCNAMANSTGWVSLAGWESVVVPFILEGHRHASGGWSVTHAIEVAR